MKRIAILVVSSLIALGSMAQTSTAAPSTGPANAAIDVQLANTLLQLQQASEDVNVALGRLRIDKWKTDGRQKQQAQSNVEALQRNLSAALPELIQNERANPQNIAVNFKLYRNLSAVYDVLASVTESAGAFGPKDQYEALANPVSTMDTVRRSLGDRMESLAAAKEAELARLRAHPAAANATSANPPVKKIVVDDNAPAPKTKKTKPKSTNTTTPQ